MLLLLAARPPGREQVLVMFMVALKQFASDLANRGIGFLFQDGDACARDTALDGRPGVS